MKSTLPALLLLWALAPARLFAQNGFAETYPATEGFGGKFIQQTAFGYKIFADKMLPASGTTTRSAFETGPDGTFWGISSVADYPQPPGTLTDVAPSGDYATTEVTQSIGPDQMPVQTLRIRRWYAGAGVHDLVAEVVFPATTSLQLDRLAFQEGLPSGIFLAGSYRTVGSPELPVPFVVRASSNSFSWQKTDLQAVPFSFLWYRLVPLSDGGCAAAFKTYDETHFVQRFNADHSLGWRRAHGLLDQITSLAEGPGHSVFYTVEDAPLGGPNPTYGTAAAIAPNGAVIWEKSLNTVLSQFSVLPRYVLPLASGEAVVAGFASPILGVPAGFFMAKLSASGALIWQRRYNYFPNGATFAFGKTTPDAGYIFTGMADNAAFLFKIDQNGVDGALVQYCPAKSNFPWEDWIAGVKIGSINNPSGKSQFSNFTAQSANLAAGASAVIELTTGFSYFTFDEYWKVWIDLNQDGVFADPGEAVLSQIAARPPNGTTSKALTANVLVPPSALPGPTRMRVSMGRGAFPQPCGTQPFGEVEDYTVNILPGGPLPNLLMTAWEVIPGGSGYCFTNPGSTFAAFGGVVLNLEPTGGSAFSIKSWLSSDNTLGNADDILWQTSAYPAFSGSSSGSTYLGGIVLSAPVPAATPLGFYKAFVKVDADNAVAETNETDNLFVADVQIGAPDLGLQNLANVPASVPLGGALGFFAEVKYGNNFPKSGLAASQVNVQAYLSLDPALSLADDVLIGSQSFSYNEFNAAGLAPKNFSFGLPGTVAPGDYYLILRVDPSANCESNYADNTLVGPALRVLAGQPGVYCASSSAFPWEDWIGSVKVGSTEKTSGKSPYSDFTTTSFSIVKGAPVPVALTSAFSYFTYDEYWKIWVDYNQNSVFEEPIEVALQQILPRPADGPNVTKTLLGSLTAPLSALPGTTRMRVTMRPGAFASPCENVPFGEVEDYSVSIAQPLAAGAPRVAKPVQIADNQEFAIFPNPAGEAVFVQTPQGGAGKFLVKIFDQQGVLRYEERFEKSANEAVRISLADFPNGVYWAQILPENARAIGKKLLVLRGY